MPEGQTIDTIGVPSVLAVYNWPKNNDRYRRVARFVEALYTKWGKLLEAPRHPKWRRQSRGDRSGLDPIEHRRGHVAQAEQDAVAEAPSNSGEFSAFLRTRTAATDTPEQREVLSANSCSGATTRPSATTTLRAGARPGKGGPGRFLNSNDPAVA